MNKQKTKPTGRKPQQDPRSCYFMCAVLAIYEKDGENKQRHLNLLLQSDDARVSKAHLTELHKTAAARLKAENDVDPHQFKDLVFLNIFPLGLFTPEEFHGPAVQEQEPAHAGH